jgi:hypothetical protein
MPASRPTIAGEGGTGELGEVSAAGATGVALATAAIVAVALGGRLSANQAGGHRPPNLPAPHNFPDSPGHVPQARSPEGSHSDPLFARTCPSVPVAPGGAECSTVRGGASLAIGSRRSAYLTGSFSDWKPPRRLRDVDGGAIWRGSRDPARWPPRTRLGLTAT